MFSSGKASITRVEISTAPVESTSESESAAVARITAESIRRPMVRLNSAIQSLTRMEPPSTAAEIQLRSGGSGVMIFATDSLSSSTPMSRIRKETIMDATYSMRACPKGCSRSAGLAEMRKEINEMICEPASDRLLMASARMETDPVSKPTANFAPNSSILSTTPTTLTMVPYARRTMGEDVFLWSRTNRRESRLVIYRSFLRGPASTAC